MAIIEDWLPPSRENWELVSLLFQWFPIFASLQLIVPWYGMGKTSTKSIFNLPGKIGWLTMEAPGSITLLYIMCTLPGKIGIERLPWENWCMAGLFTIHYLYRSLLSILITPSISPIHTIIWLCGIGFQLANAISIGGWLAGYGLTTREDWANHQSNYMASIRMGLGLAIWATGFFLTIFHDGELREIRRAAARDQRRRATEAEASTAKEKVASCKASINKIYAVPQNGMFKWILYPHYLFEWLEWTGYWILGGAACFPARIFLVNEIVSMLPRAVRGKKWYVDRFGKEKVGSKKAIIPGIL